MVTLREEREVPGGEALAAVARKHPSWWELLMFLRHQAIVAGDHEERAAVAGGTSPGPAAGGDRPARPSTQVGMAGRESPERTWTPT